MITITIHRGELRHICRIITDSEDKDKRKLKGTLHGLWTESGQPVIQLVTKGKKKLEILRNGHGLKELGEWIVAAQSFLPREGNLSLVFDLEGKSYHAYDTKGNPAYLEIIEGQSAFRFYEPLTNALCELTGVDNSPITDEKEQDELFVDTACYNNDFKSHVNKSSYNDEAASHTVDMPPYDDVRTQTKTIQWYNSNRDTLAKTVDFVHSKLSDQNNLQISRNIETENMTIRFTHHSQCWILEFPSEFPLGVAELKRINSSESTDTSIRMWVEKVSTYSPHVQCMYKALSKTLTAMCTKCHQREMTYV